MKAWTLLLALALAGCADGPRVPDGIPLDPSGDPLPTVRGVVVDDAIRPLAGATVRILGTDVAGTTDEEGRYALLRPTFVAEAALVAATMPGYLTRSAQVQLSGNIAAEVDFQLPADPSVVPHTEVLQHRGQVRCTAAVSVLGGVHGAGCEGDRRDDHDILPRWMWEINPRPGVAGVVVEVHWDAGTPAATELRAWLKAPMAGGQGGEVVAEAVGPSPLRLEVPEDAVRSYARWTAVRLHVETAPGTAGATREQAYDAFATVFYVDPAPAGYLLP